MKRQMHGKHNTRLYRIWGNMKGRCYCKSRREYKNYGGRGIKVCDEWQQDFQAFYDWAMSHGYTDTLTLDRIDVNGNYEPSNCRWITNKEQQNNRQYNKLISYNGRTQTLAQWASEYNMCYKTLQKRINKWGIEKAFNEPLRNRKMFGVENPKSRSVICVETGKIFETVTLAAKSVNRNHTAVSACCKGKSKTCGGYHWRYANE